jgi:phosphocarrier protein HPr
MRNNGRPSGPSPQQRCGRDCQETQRSIAASGIFQCLAEVTIVNQKGLHARASAEFVKLAQRFDAEIAVTKGDQTVGGSSIMGLLMLGAGKGTTILIETDGPDAEEALEALTELVEAGFNDKDFNDRDFNDKD